MASVIGDLQGGQGVGPPAAVSALRMGLGYHAYREAERHTPLYRIRRAGDACRPTPLTARGPTPPRAHRRVAFARLRLQVRSTTARG